MLLQYPDSERRERLTQNAKGPHEICVPVSRVATRLNEERGQHFLKPDII